MALRNPTIDCGETAWGRLRSRECVAQQRLERARGNEIVKQIDWINGRCTLGEYRNARDKRNWALAQYFMCVQEEDLRFMELAGLDFESLDGSTFDQEMAEWHEKIESQYAGERE